MLDCFKTRVYDLANYRNSVSPSIPQEVIGRAPSAELRHDQTDQDSLPPYEELDLILERYVEKDESIASIVAAGFSERVVRKIAGLVLQSEYKRRQAPPGVRITARAFGRDRRYPDHVRISRQSDSEVISYSSTTELAGTGRFL